MAKFKKGDKVIIVDDGSLQAFQRGYVGMTGVVGEVNSDAPYVVMDVDECRLPFHEDKLKVVPKYNIGDKVTVINCGCTYHTYSGWIDKYAPTYKNQWHNGCVAEHGDFTVVAMGEHEDEKDNMLYLISNETGVYIVSDKALEKTAIKAVPVFKQGDKVVIIDSSVLVPGYEVGDVATVIRPIEENIMIKMSTGGLQIIYAKDVAKQGELTVDQAKLVAKAGQCIRGTQWTCGSESHIYFNGHDFCFVLPNGREEPVSCGFDWNNWEVIEVLPLKPKFSKGSLFTTASGKLGKVTGDAKLYSDHFVYPVKWAMTNKASWSTPESDMNEVSL